MSDQLVPVEFSLGDLAVTPASVEAGGSVSVSVTLTNSGDIEGD